MSPGDRAIDPAQPEHLRVQRTARVWTWGPEDADELWIVLHGYRQLAERFIARFEPLARAGIRVLAPEGLSRFYLEAAGGSQGPDARIGATWMTREDREAEISDYVAYLDGVWDRYVDRSDGRAPRVTALGFSQGVHTVSRWLSFGACAPERVVLWGARLPHDLDVADVVERWRAAEVVLVHGDSDPFDSAEGRARDEARLEAAGVPFVRRSHPQGHRIDGPLLEELAGGH